MSVYSVNEDSASAVAAIVEVPDLSSNVCSICNGYYGPCFENPVCATCHAFIFPDDLIYNVPLNLIVLSEKTDDGDSGNDEPPDVSHLNDIHYAYINTSGRRTPPPRVDLLANRLAMLTTARDGDNLPEGLVEWLPSEILFAIFSYLDDMSLWSLANVCKRWNRLLSTQLTDDTWHSYTMDRWPLYKPIAAVKDWYKIYTRLLESSPCRACVVSMSHKDDDEMILQSAWRKKRLTNEIRSLAHDPLEGIEVVSLDANRCRWQATITGPVGSPYEGGLFFIYLTVPYGYPMCPPIVKFLTKIFHPNVSRHGDVGIDSIQHNWSLALTISKVLISIQSLLTDPYCNICMEPEIGKLYLMNKPLYEKTARAWTWKYAMHDIFM